MAPQDKKRQIIEAAIRCFARKGVHATSIQEIVDELGMAKGSIYFYFKSKDDLLISIFEYYGEFLFANMEGLPEEWGLPPREKLALQLERQFRFFREHLDFMRMLLKEPLTGLHPDIQKMLHRFRARATIWNVSQLLAIYGTDVERHLGDASVLLSGITSHYFETILIDESKLDEGRLSRFLVNRLDDLIQGIQRSGDSPILPNPNLAELRRVAGFAAEEADEANAWLEEMSAAAASASEADGWDENTRGDIMSALSLLKDEAAKPFPNRLVVRAMVSLLKQDGLTAWHARLDQLEQRLGRE